jgi:type IV pilus assembly protein PilM
VALSLSRTERVALDIGGSSLLALQIAGASGKLKLRGCYEWPLSEGLVVDGEIVDVDLFARELKAFASQYGFRGRSVHLAVGNQKVIVRNIDMPVMTEEELRGAIEFQAQDYIPIPVEEAVLDFQIIGKSTGADGASRQEVLLVAAQRAMIGMFTAAVRQAGLKVAGIDISSMALVRALIPPTSFLADVSEGAPCRAIADISSSVSTLVVAVGDVMKFTRIINFSSDRFARVLGEQLGVPFDDAQGLAQRVGLPGPVPADEGVYAEEVLTDARQRLLEIASQLSDEIRRSLHYYQGQPSAVPATELILSGRGALVRNLDAHLSEALNIPVSIGNPLAHVGENASKTPDATLAFMAPSLSVALGLALPEED